MDDKETPFAELFAADAADNLKFRGEERGDKAVQDADAISGLVTFPSKRKKIKIHGIGSSVLQFMSPAAEVGLGGPSAWGDDE
ncbi:hypothetical protein Nepgr_014518 [Nepenthes gracilis]|uniref:Uncharacterized protein n=1 Tax=Nepenthes gracilis TaxID=150966 RepID=A0AAD3SL89_NEPGR|nr:hypothetical protein Nepgr_014518 [Nepenthes gracilis]